MRVLPAAVLVVAVAQAAANYWDAKAPNQQVQVNIVFPKMSRLKKSWIKQESDTDKSKIRILIPA